MAILCLADSPADLRTRLDRILVGYSPRTAEPVLAKRDRRDRRRWRRSSTRRSCRTWCRPPNRRRRSSTAARSPTSPTAATRSLATRMALAMADYAVTEAGFAFDLGGEKFFDLKCRSAGLNPAAIVIVATVRALKMHGGVAAGSTPTEPNPGAVERGLENLAAHLDSAAHFGKPTVVAINQFATDTADELELVHDYCESRGVPCATANVFGAGGQERSSWPRRSSRPPPDPRPRFSPFTRWTGRPSRRSQQIARVMYGADGVNIQPAAEAKLRKASKLGYGRASDLHGQDPGLALRQPQAPRPPARFTLTVRDIEIAAGAGFLVALTGEIVRMPGLPERPAAERIDVDLHGSITGLS